MINEIINEKNIEIYLQPIVSIKDKKIFAYEALTRATDRYGESISPLYLFEQAKKENLSYKLDEYVRELALEKFTKYYYENKDLLLFLNFEAAAIEHEGKESFISNVYRYNISPSNIVVEIKEDKIKDSHRLKEFIANYKNHDFLIAIDDFGTGYSSFDRLEFINPHIVKIDRSLIYNIHNNFINSEILTAISRMCHNLGIMVLAEGVESSDEVLTCMKKDIDIFQGFWFSKPLDEIDEIVINGIISSLSYTGNEYKNRIKKAIQTKQELLKYSNALVRELLEIFEHNGFSNLEKLNDIVIRNKNLEAIYFIDDESGLQIGDTIIDAEKRYLYIPSKEGMDHSLREYYFIAKEASRGDYLSPRYISKASGNICRTYSALITFEEKNYIACFDIVD